MRRLLKSTSIARLIDPRYPTNLAIILLVAVVIVATGVNQFSTGNPSDQSIAAGIAAGVAVLFAWILARELDPDHDLSAFVGAGLALLGTLVFEPSNIIGLLLIGLLIRIVNRSVGPPATWLDSLLILGLAAALSLNEHGLFGIMAATAFFIDSQLPPPHKRHVLFAILALVLAAVAIFDQSAALQGELSQGVFIAVIAIAVLFIPVIVSSRQLTATSDVGSQPLNPTRVRVAQLIAMAMALVFSVLTGDVGAISIMPLWAAFLGVSAYRLLITGRGFIFTTKT